MCCDEQIIARLNTLYCELVHGLSCMFSAVSDASARASNGGSEGTNAGTLQNVSTFLFGIRPRGADLQRHLH